MAGWARLRSCTNNLAGPSVARSSKNKLFYFGSYECIKQNYNVPRSAQQISELNALAAALPQYGIVTNGSVPQPSTDNTYMGKVNWQPNAAHTEFFRWSGEVGCDLERLFQQYRNLSELGAVSGQGPAVPA